MPKTLIKLLYGAYRQLVSLIPLGFKQAAKNKLVSASHFLLKRPALGSALFSLLQMIARLTGVDPVILARAKTIAKDRHAPESAGRLLIFYIRLALGLTLPGFAYNIANQLPTDEEKNITMTLLRQALPGVKKGEARNIMQMHLYRLEKRGPDDEKMKAYCHQLIDEALADRQNQPVSAMSNALEANGLKALQEIKERFEAHGKRFFLSSGTLLGAVRDKGFIGGDLDIDLGVFSDEIDKDELRKILSGSFFYLDRDFEHELAFITADDVLVEFFFCQRDDKHVTMYSYGGTHEWRFSAFDLIEYQFLGQSFLIPDNTEKHLQENFGNWRDKAQFFDWAFDVPCAQYSDNLETMVFLAQRFRKALQEGDRHIAQLAARDMKEQFGIDYTEYFPNA